MPAGRPSKYDPKLNKQVFKLALLGAKDTQIADFLEIAESTLNKWKEEYPELMESLKKGKDQADANVSNSLYKQAIGFKRKEVKIFQYEGSPVVVDYTAYYPPNATAAIFWLKNRQPSQWRDKQEQTIEHTGTVSFGGIEIVKPDEPSTKV